MFYYALAFLIVVVATGLLGFVGAPGAASGIAQVLFYVFLLALIVSVSMGLIRRSK